MEDLEHNEPSYYPAAVKGGVIIGVFTFVVSLIFGYIQISADPSASSLLIMVGLSLVSCIVGAFGGLIAVWFYSGEVDFNLQLGKGAVIGIVTGIVIVLTTTILNQIWNGLNPAYNEQLLESMIASIESMDLPDAQEQTQVDMIYNSMKSADSFTGVLKSLLGGALLYGVLNMITGLIGIKLFAQAKRERDPFE